MFIPDGHKSLSSHLEVLGFLGDFPDLWPLMPSQDIFKLMDFQNYHDDLDGTWKIEDQKIVLINKAKELFS